ncbi:MAG: alpha/beta fold hydrolase [Gaiellaceae bacterium]
MTGRIARTVAVVAGGVVVGVLVLVTLGSLAYNAATSDADVPVTQLWHGRFVEADGVLTAYRRWGTHGSPIVLVGGFLEPSFVWRGVGPQLARAGHRVYALDLDGFGYTQRRGPSTLAEWADQVQGFAKALGLHRPLVVGHSLGAAVAVEVAHRGGASRIVLLDGDALGGGGPPGWIRTALLHTPFYTTGYRLVPHASWVVRRILETAYGPNRPKLDGAEIRRWTDQLRARGARQGLRRLAEHGLAGFTTAELGRMRLRATVVWGVDDQVDEPSAGRATARLLHAPFVEIRHAGHLSMLSEPNTVAAAILR